jgi:hypothetical protein
MSEAARNYQSQVTGAPRGWVYRIFLNGQKADFDGYDPQAGVLLDAKGTGYDKWFDKNFKHKPYYQGADELVERARRQLEFAQGVTVRWHVAEPRMVGIIKKLFATAGINGIEVVHTAPLPPRGM